MKAMKLGLLLIGGINAAIAAALLVARGYSVEIVAYLVVGLAVFVLGALWK